MNLWPTPFFIISCHGSVKLKRLGPEALHNTLKRVASVALVSKILHVGPTDIGCWDLLKHHLWVQKEHMLTSCDVMMLIFLNFDTPKGWDYTLHWEFDGGPLGHEAWTSKVTAVHGQSASLPSSPWYHRPGWCESTSLHNSTQSTDVHWAPW